MMRGEAWIELVMLGIQVPVAKLYVVDGSLGETDGMKAPI